MVELHQGDCLEVMKTLDRASIDAVIADPPYGMGYKSNHNTARRKAKWAGYERHENFAPIHGDDSSFDPSPWLDYPTVALFGANYFADRLPVKRGWVIWDKRRDTTPDQASDCEMIWTNSDSVTRIYRHLWRGIVREGEENVSRQPKHHPNQKPVALMIWILNHLGIPSGATVLDPYMGSGSTGVACVRTGRRFIGIEVDRKHFATAKRRIEAEQASTPLFNLIREV